MNKPSFLQVHHCLNQLQAKSVQSWEAWIRGQKLFSETAVFREFSHHLDWVGEDDAEQSDQIFVVNARHEVNFVQKFSHFVWVRRVLYGKKVGWSGKKTANVVNLMADKFDSDEKLDKGHFEAKQMEKVKNFLPFFRFFSLFSVFCRQSYHA